jgi:hypothetical protein
MTAPVDLYTPDRLIKQALRDCGRLQFGSTPTSEQVDDAQSRLHDIINTWQTQGLKLWLNSIVTLTLVADQISYTIGPAASPATLKSARILAGWYVSSTGSRRPLHPLSWTDYNSLGNHATSGAVNSYFVDKQLLNLVIKLWSPPNTAAATGTVELLRQEQAVAWTEVDEDVAFPVEWFQALRWGLADELCSGQPQLIMERCERKANMYRQLLEDWDVEDVPTRVTPDMGGMARSRFNR